MTTKWAPSDERLKCKTCLSKAVESAFENWVDLKGHPLTESEYMTVMQWAVDYIASDITTPCEAHVAPEPEIVDLPCHDGCAWVGVASVYQNLQKGWWMVECRECCSVLGSGYSVGSRDRAMEIAIEHVKHNH